MVPLALLFLGRDSMVRSLPVMGSDAQLMEDVGLLDALTLVSDEAQGDEGSNSTDTGVEDFGPSCTSGLVGVASDGRAT